MPARDRIHEIVKNALIKDGWTITHDPFTIFFGKRALYADLGADKPLAAEKGTESIVVESKSFASQSEIYDLEHAIGQFVLYRVLMQNPLPNSKLFLAMPEIAFQSLFEDAIGLRIIEHVQLKILTVDFNRAEIVRWVR